MSRVRTIFSHGKYMKVVKRRHDPPARKPRDKQDDFAMVPLELGG